MAFRLHYLWHSWCDRRTALTLNLDVCDKPVTDWLMENGISEGRGWKGILQYQYYK